MILGQFVGMGERETQRTNGDTFSVLMRPKGRSGGPNGPLEKTWSTSETDCADRMKGSWWEGEIEVF